MKIFKTLCLAGAAMSLFAACDSSEQIKTDDNNWSRIELNQKEQTLVSECNTFAFNIFEKTTKDRETAVMSPYGVWATLSMVANGAESETLGEILTAMGFDSEFTANDLKQLYKTTYNAGDYLKIRNALFHHNSLHPSDSYVNDLTDYFHAGVMEYGDDPKTAANVINSYFSDVIGNLINAADGIDPNPRSFFLFNVMNFSGKWEAQFNPELTKPVRFYSADGTSQLTDMMHASVSLPSYMTDGFSVIEFPYKGGYSFIGVLPDENMPVSEWLETVDRSDVLDIIQNRMNRHMFEIGLPKFEIVSDYNLIDPLKEMGIERLFDNRKSQLSNIFTDRNASINLFRQKIALTLDEEGTKVESSTVAGGSISSAGRNVTFDHPFLFMLIDRRADNILFIGKVDKL